MERWKVGNKIEEDKLIDFYLDPSAEDHEEIVEWAGEDFDPDKFDIKEINPRLKMLQTD
ncbi:plasmid pRiA4b ORF-3 family protein [Athalassotoga saccharophila]|uniref:plasmid pRiA4b ORF-3 family protein n=1 Tax=Athalassotoga saccharophila TaxID=1441386 RepID=UPI00137A7BC6|nr:plasmid pRiA4b ORF-3 family protein [Athalassotoga saccharophila]